MYQTERFYIFLFITLMGAGMLKNCSRNGAKISATEAKLVAKNADDFITLLPAYEKEILKEAITSVTLFENSKVLKDAKFKADFEIVSDVLSFISNIIDPDLFKDENSLNKFIDAAARDLAFSKKGIIISNIIQYKKNIKLSDFELYKLLILDEVKGIKLNKKSRDKLLYTYSDKYAALYLSSCLIQAKCNREIEKELTRVINYRGLSDNKWIRKIKKRCSDIL